MGNAQGNAFISTHASITLKKRTRIGVQGQGVKIGDAVRQIGVTQQTYSRWRRAYSGMSRDPRKRLKEFERQNSRLRLAISDLTLDKLILSDAARANY